MRKYTTLLFDNDNTLMDFTLSEATAVAVTLKQFSLPSDSETISLYSKINQGFWEAYERGEIEKNEIFAGRFARLLSLIGGKVVAEEMWHAYEENLSKQYFMIDGAVSVCEALKKKYSMYIITNGTASVQENRLKNSGLQQLFDGVFISEKVGYQKPKKEFFNEVIKSITEKDKSNILIIGDSMSSDILGGINSGIDTCWFNPDNQKPKYNPTYEIKSLSELCEML